MASLPSRSPDLGSLSRGFSCSWCPILSEEESKCTGLNCVASVKAYPGSRGINCTPRVGINIAFRPQACNGLINSAFKGEEEKLWSFESHYKLLLLLSVLSTFSLKASHNFIFLFFFFYFFHALSSEKERLVTTQAFRTVCS